MTDRGLRDADRLRERSGFCDRNTDLCKHRCDGGGRARGGLLLVSALRTASVCVFFSGLGAHCMWVDTFLSWLCFCSGLSFWVAL